MFYLIPLLFVFVCVSSIFYPGLRKLAACMISTVFVLVFGIWSLFAIFHG